MKKYLVYKDQISGFEEVKETIRVVEKAAASHIHFLKKQVEILLSYKKDAKKMLARLSEFEQNENHSLLQKRQSGDKALLVIGGNKGIVGSLYHDLISLFLENKGNYKEVWVLGGKIREYLSEEGIEIKQFFPLSAEALETGEIESLSAQFFSDFQSHRLKSIDILYPEFFSLTEQYPAFVKFLPFDLTKNGPLNSEEAKGATKVLKNGEGLPIFEPAKKDIFDALLKKYINVFFRQIIMEASLSEFAARTVTAENAIYKTRDIINNLNLAFFKERRKLISQKQLESFVGHKTI